MSEEIVAAEPWLVKEGTRPGSWKKRFFVIGKNALYYFSKQEEGTAYKNLVDEGYADPPAKCLGSVPLENCSLWYGNPSSRVYCSESVKDSSPLGYFEIITSNRRYRYFAPNQSQRLAWRQAIADNRAIAEPWLLRFHKYDAHRNMVLEGTLGWKDSKGKIQDRLCVATFNFLLLFKKFENHTPEKCIPLKGASFEGDPATMIMKITTATGEEIEMECPDQFCMDRWRGFLNQMATNQANIERIQREPNFEVSEEEPDSFVDAALPDLSMMSGGKH